MSETEEALLRSAALQNAQSIRLARQRAEQELLDAKEALERKTEELAHSLSVMRATLDSTTDGILVVDHQDNITGFNERFLTMWGMPRNLIESRERKPLLEHAVKVLKDPKGFLTATEQIYASGPAESFDVLELADGRVFERYSRVQTIEGKNLGRVWSYRDVTERMRADEVSRVSHALFAAIINQSPVGIFLLDSDLRLQHINPKAVPVFGTIENLLGRDFAQVMHVLWPAAVADELMQHFRHTLATGEPFVSHGFAEVRRDRAVQEYYDWQIHRITLPDGRQGVVCYFIDISAHVLAQQALRRSEEELRALADSIPQLAWMAAPDGDIFWYNRGWYEYTGTTLEQMRGWGWQSVHDPKMVPLVVERWQKSIETAEPFEMEFPLRGSDGIFRWFLTRVNPLRNAEGRVLRWFGTNTDVDQVKRAEAALRDEAGILDLLNKTGSSIAAQLDLQAVVQIVTDAGTQLSGASFGAFFYTQRDESGGSFLLYALSGAPREAFDKFGHPRATALFGPTFRGEGVIRSDDILKDPRYGKMEPHHGMPKGHLPVRSYLAVPVISSSGEVIGGLFFGHPEAGVFTERTERIIVAVAAQAGIAIDNARLYDAAQKELQERKRAEADRERLLTSEKEARERAERET
ncbi:MAG: PAS domain S-box protein, partial [Verrucomicrobiota bacterium]|nr:PAS domain S-box protein [Verrucomicrobiota bacterium]